MNEMQTSQTPQTIEGSFLTQLQQRDSVLIADQLRYGFRLDSVQDNTGLALPDFEAEGQSFAEGWELVRGWELDTVKVHKARKGEPASYDIEASVVVTTFDEGEYVLPSLAVARHLPDGMRDTLIFDPQQIKVTSIPVDTATFTVHDIKPQVNYPVTFKEIAPYMGGGIVAAGLVALLVWFLMKRKKAQVEALRQDPAHIVALRKLDKYRGDKLWIPEKQKGFYSGVTDTLREYLEGRYGVSAMEMTTKETMQALKSADIPEDLKKELQQLFETADYVKFAKYVADNEENAKVVPFAVRFVTSTYQAEIENEV